MKGVFFIYREVRVAYKNTPHILHTGLYDRYPVVIHSLSAARYSLKTLVCKSLTRPERQRQPARNAVPRPRRLKEALKKQGAEWHGNCLTTIRLSSLKRIVYGKDKTNKDGFL